MTSLADKILAASLERVAVDVPEWSEALGGVKLYVRELTGAERGKIEAAFTADADVSRLRLKLVAMTLETESGEAVFTKPADLAGLSGAVVGRLSDTALTISGLSEDALDDAVKN